MYKLTWVLASFSPSASDASNRYSYTKVNAEPSRVLIPLIPFPMRVFDNGILV